MAIMLERHPYNTREPIPDDTRLVVIGTAPPPRFSNPACGGMRGLDFDFFYGSEDNYMWEFLENIAKRKQGVKLFGDDLSPQQCCDAARKFLRDNRIWMHDVLSSYQRKESKEHLADDAYIIPVELSSFRELLHTAAISKLAFTSEKAAEWTFTALIQEGQLANPEHLKAAFKEWRAIDRGLEIEAYVRTKFKEPFIECQIGGRNFHLHILPTPTRRSGVKGLTLGLKEDIYEHVLF
ncbi:hypothetical protein [Nitrobacter vulgaris]|uniref:DNA glycosylase n=1 Tax=Nitrobacter vulgaris TaxID=29421 RepID=A0A1V4HYT8_NITVU|nr:hypothetical protein [Nitrobacter vulgaris]OPH83127.1 hypothetical protein B2M20_09120 [Nitrobacter vulgaris]